MIISCGEALIDMLPRRTADGREAFLPVPGGGPFNTALALGRLGVQAGFLSGLSRDGFGRMLCEHLHASGVETGLAIRSANPTTLAFARLRQGKADYSFYDENSAGRMLRVGDLPELPDETEALHFGGISLIAEPCGAAYEAFAAHHAERLVIALDPNIRPAFVADEPAYRARLRRMIAMSDIVKVSDEDLAWLEPDKTFQDVAGEWLSGGASLVVLTLGEAGCKTVTAGLEAQVEAQTVAVVDTVGAGDAFNAGLLAALSRADLLSKERLRRIGRDDLVAALRFATKVAARTVARAGADPPWLKELAVPWKADHVGV